MRSWMSSEVKFQTNQQNELQSCAIFLINLDRFPERLEEEIFFDTQDVFEIR